MLFIILGLITTINIIYYLYPEYYEKIIILILYNCVFYYSKIQMYFMKLNFIKSYFLIKPYDIEFIQNGQIVYKTYKSKLELITEKEIPSFDFIIYSDNQLYNDIPVNKIIYYSIPQDFNYIKTNFKFIVIQLLHQNITNNIVLSNNKYNYYIINNLINDKFLLYFLNNVENYNITKLTDYNLQIMDHNINQFSLSPTDNLLFNKDDYIKNT
jgi:hypothetical protein